MLNSHALRQRRDGIMGELRQIADGAEDALNEEQRAKAAELRGQVEALDGDIALAELIEEEKRGMHARSLTGGGDAQFERLAAQVTALDVIRAQMGGTDAACGRAREVSAELERRSTGRTLHGIAAPFNRPADIAGLFRETILPGAFAKTLAGNRDILALANHRSDALLGRTRSGTLQLRETPAGLEYSLDLPATSLGNDLLALAQRGDLGGMSIAFTADAEAWPDKTTRQLRSVQLHEISVVSGHPAYDGTSIALRSRARLADPAGVAALQSLRAFLATEMRS